MINSLLDGVISPRINFGLFDSIGSAVDGISDYLKNMGDWCLNVLNGALEVFNNLVTKAVLILTADPDSSQFADFWKIINRVTGVLSSIAITIMVMLFLINMCSDALESRQEMDLWGFMKMVFKLCIGVVLVGNATKIVTAIFKIGTTLSKVITLGGDFEALKLDAQLEPYIKHGVSGVQGLLQSLVFIIVALVIIGSGVMICVEMYERIFKMFVLIPFSTISFTTFVMGSGNQGNQIFIGYLKSIISIAFETLIIVVCLGMTYSLIGNRNLMEELFPALKDEAPKTYKDCNYDEIELVSRCLKEPALVLDTESEINSVGNSFMNVRKDIKNIYIDKLSNGFTYSTAVVTQKDGKTSVLSGYDDLSDMMKLNNLSKFALSAIGSSSTIEAFEAMQEEEVKQSFKGSDITLYPEFSWKQIFMILLQVVFPIVLCTSAIKKSSQFAAIVMGRG